MGNFYSESKATVFGFLFAYGASFAVAFFLIGYFIGCLATEKRPCAQEGLQLSVSKTNAENWKTRALIAESTIEAMKPRKVKP